MTLIEQSETLSNLGEVELRYAARPSPLPQGSLSKTVPISEHRNLGANSAPSRCTPFRRWAVEGKQTHARESKRDTHLRDHGDGTVLTIMLAYAVADPHLRVSVPCSAERMPALRQTTICCQPSAWHVYQRTVYAAQGRIQPRKKYEQKRSKRRLSREPAPFPPPM